MKARFYSKNLVTTCLYTGLAGIFIFSRLLFLPQYLEGLDSVNFALGLKDYNLELYQPHFPGYPLFLLAAKAFLLLGASPLVSLLLPGILAGAISAVFLYHTLKSRFCVSTALLTYLLYTFNPLLWLESLKPLSDSLGTAFFVMAFCFLIKGTNKKSLWVAGALLGLMIGVRLSYLPLLFSFGVWIYSLQRKHPESQSVKAGFQGLLTGTAVWCLVFALYLGLGNLTDIGFKFIEGHFTKWGGTVLIEPDLFNRLQWYVWDVLPNGLGFWWSDTGSIRLLPSLFFILSLAAVIANLKKGKNEEGLFLKLCLIFTIPYGVAIFFGQNLLNPRHVLPLIPVLLILIALGFSTLIKTIYPLKNQILIPTLPLALLFLMPYGLESLSLVRTHQSEPSPAYQLVDYINKHYTGEQLQVYTGEEKRLFDYYALHIPVVRVAPDNRVEKEVQKLPFKPKTLLITDHAQGYETLAPHLTLIKSFNRNRYVHNHYAQVNLFAYQSLELKGIQP